jgi:chromosome segregation ATPase
MSELNILLLSITVGIIEILIFMLGAMALGFFVHFFMSSRTTLPPSVSEPSVLAESAIHDGEDWQGKYYELLEINEELQNSAEESKSNEELAQIEIEELRKELDAADAAREANEKRIEIPALDNQAEDYLTRLKMAHEGLKEHNRDINAVLEQIEQLKRSEQRTVDTIKANELLQARIQELQQQLLNKESEEKLVQQQEFLLSEMKERLDTAYTDFNSLREKLLQLETRVGHSGRSFEYDELQQSHFRLTKEFDELKLRHISMLEENQRLARLLTDTEEKLRESNFQRQQLQKKNSFLEELNQDMQLINEQNKKLENQLKRMSEIELMLSRVSAKKPDEADEHHG